MQGRDSGVTRRLATLSETAIYAGVTERSVRRWIAGGVVPAYRLGRRAIRVDLNELDSALRPIPAGSADVA